MRFVSHIRKFGVQIVEPRVHFSNYGDRIVDREGYVAQFTADDVTDLDVEWGRKVFENGGFLHGRTTALDEVTLTDIRSRLSVFDSEEMALRENWDPDFKTLVEDFLSNRAVDNPDFRQVEGIEIPPPWPRYLDFRGTLDQLMEKLIEDGYDLGQALAFERERGHREMVIVALEAKIAELAEETQSATSVPA